MAAGQGVIGRKVPPRTAYRVVPGKRHPARASNRKGQRKARLERGGMRNRWPRIFVWLALAAVGCGQEEFAYFTGGTFPSGSATGPTSTPTVTPTTVPTPDVSPTPLTLQTCDNTPFTVNFYPPQRISVDSQGRALGTGNGLKCVMPQLSADGRHLFFRSDCVNLLRGKRSKSTRQSFGMIFFTRKT